jgi:hypothetical protein
MEFLFFATFVLVILLGGSNVFEFVLKLTDIRRRHRERMAELRVAEAEATARDRMLSMPSLEREQLARDLLAAHDELEQELKS